MGCSMCLQFDTKMFFNCSRFCVHYLTLSTVPSVIRHRTPRLVYLQIHDINQMGFEHWLLPSVLHDVIPKKSYSCYKSLKSYINILVWNISCSLMESAGIVISDTERYRKFEFQLNSSALWSDWQRCWCHASEEAKHLFHSCWECFVIIIHELTFVSCVYCQLLYEICASK